MLQATKPFTTEIDAPQESSPRELVHWALGIVRRQFVIITSVALIVASLGAVYAFTAPPTYTADATILIDPRRVQLFQGATFAEGQMDSPALESQIELVKSEPVALAVIKQLRLADDAEFLRSDAGLAGVAQICITFFCAEQAETSLCPNSRLPGAH